MSCGKGFCPARQDKKDSLSLFTSPFIISPAANSGAAFSSMRHFLHRLAKLLL
jgi:lipoprotein signal peptidase